MNTIFGYRSTHLFIMMLLITSYTFSQNDNYFSKLTEDIKASAADSIKSSELIETYINKAYELKDTIHIATGLYYTTLVRKDETHRTEILDSIINLTKGIKNENYPTIAYMDKGIVLYNERNYSEALNTYLLADKYNNGSNKDYLEHSLNYNIALLKLRIGEDKEALILLQKCADYIEKENVRERNPNQYLNNLFFLANAYRKNNLWEKAKTLTDLGHKESKTFKSDLYKHSFKILDGILYLNDNNNKSIALLEEGTRYMERINYAPNLGVGYHYLGRAYQLANDTLRTIKYYEKVDSLFQNNHNLLPELTTGYSYLINYYQASGNIQKELEYIKRLISIDSIYRKEYKFLSSKIKTDYEIPKLLDEKQNIILRLKNEKNKTKYTYIYIIISIIIFFSILILSQRRLLQYKLSSIEKRKRKEKRKELSTEVYKEIEDKLNHFEKKLGFLDKNITLVKVAKDFDTNTNYLSKVINEREKKNFSLYIKNLRIKYAYDILKNKPKLRSYTIKAIAVECGFKRPESFSKAFYEEYDIYPSAYIKQLTETTKCIH